jgi:glycosyltransferase involved in cell wall biosynthesis
MSFAIVTPSYNKAKYLRRSMLSVLTQEKVEIDYLVLDNCSTDGSIEILNELQRHYPNQMRLIIEPDEGQAAAINRGFNLTGGDIMGWLNADDSYLPGAFSKVRDFFQENQDIDLVYGRTKVLDASFRVNGNFPTQSPSLRTLRSFDYISQPAAFWRRRVWEAVGPLDADLYWGMDWDFFLRACQRFRVAFLDDFLAEAVCDGDHKSGQRGSKLTKELGLIGRRHGGFLNPTHLFCQYVLILNWLASPFLRHPSTALITARAVESLRARSMTFLSHVLDVQVMS